MSGLDATERPDAHTALVRTRVGKVVVAVLVIVMSVWIVGPNIPASPVRDRVEVVWSPAIKAGFKQNWSVFSPNPRAQALEVVAVAEFADGTTTEWTLPELGQTIGAYRSYRWRKWQERIRLDSNARYWDSSAAWIARDVARGDELPVSVRLIRRWRDIKPLTANGIVDTKVNEFEFHVWGRVDG